MSPSQPADAASPPAPRSWAKIALYLLAAAALIAAAVLWGRQGQAFLQEHLEGFRSWIDGIGFWGPAAFIAAYAVLTVAMIPGSLLTLAAGFIFGVAEGTLYVFIGSSLGASAAFLIGRYLARRAVERKIEGSEKFSAIDRAVGEQGLKIVFLLRLSPVFPFNLLNYSLGLTKVRFRHYLLACFGMLPGTLLYVYYGSTIEAIATLATGTVEKGAASWALWGLGLVATVVVTVFVTRIARKALRDAADV